MGLRYLFSIETPFQERGDSLMKTQYLGALMKSEKRSLLFIFVTVLVDVIGVAVIIPVIPELIGNLAEVSIAEAASIGGMMMMSFSAMQFLFAPVMGELSDRFGRRPILLISLFGLGLDYLFHAFAPTIVWLFVGRVIAGICGATITVANAYIADVSTPENKAKNFGMIGAAFGLGFILGPVIGGVFGEYFGFRAPFFVSAALALGNMVYGYFILPESLPAEKRRPIVLKNMIPGASLVNLRRYKAFGGLLIAFFLSHLAGQAMPSVWTFFTIEKFGWSELEIGASLAAVGFMVVLVQAVLLGWLVKRLGSHRVVKVGFLFWTTGMILFSMASQSWQMYAFLVPYALGGIAGPTIQSLLSNHVPQTEQGNLQGALTSMISLTAIIGPLIHTQLFFFFSGGFAPVYFPGAPFAVGAVFLIVGSVLAIVSMNRLKASSE
ncbi:MAG: DHA1 family tetracycline resistance protein-like MFS transporter [Flavobacteriales bacterium]|jgi:DHA1 family tetracycline resistance protein-like MFS transporter